MIHKKHVNRYAEIQDEDFDSVSKHFEQITHSSMNEMNNFLNLRQLIKPLISQFQSESHLKVGTTFQINNLPNLYTVPSPIIWCGSSRSEKSLWI